MTNRNDREEWDDGKIYVVCIGLASAVEIALDVIQGTMGMALVATDHLAQLGAVFGSGVFVALIATLGREFFRKKT